MLKTILAGVLVAAVMLLLPLGANADSGQGHKADGVSEGGHSGAHGGHGVSRPQPASLAGAWTVLMAARDAIAGDVERGALGDVHAKAEPLPKLVAALLEESGDLDAGKRTRLEGAAKQVTRVADALHVAADRGDATRTRRELSRLDGLLELIRAQYPAGALDAGTPGHKGHSAAPGHADRAHAHLERPAGSVEATPQATLRVRALDRFRFEPKRLEVKAGVPTRIELENAGVAEHSLVVKTPDGSRDWIHLHARPGATEAATYQLDHAGTYPVVCMIPGHTDAGMVAELVVVAGTGGTHRH